MTIHWLGLAHWHNVWGVLEGRNNNNQLSSCDKSSDIACSIIEGETIGLWCSWYCEIGTGGTREGYWLTVGLVLASVKVSYGHWSARRKFSLIHVFRRWFKFQIFFFVTIITFYICAFENRFLSYYFSFQFRLRIQIVFTSSLRVRK